MTLKVVTLYKKAERKNSYCCKYFREFWEHIGIYKI